MIRSILILLTCLICISSSRGQTNETITEEPIRDNMPSEHPIYCVIFHTPGPNWKSDIPFQEQPGIIEHVQYMRQRFQEGLMVMGGPFMDNSGGMMILRHVDIEKAKTIANADPAVKSGLLKVEVKTWMVPMSSVQKVPGDFRVK